MSNIPVARRYARALLDAAQASNVADVVLEQLEALSGFFDHQKELFAAMASPALSKNQRMALTDAVIKAVPGLNGILVNLLKLLTDRSRFSSLAFITRQYRDLVDARVGRVRGQVTSAIKLGDEQLASIRRALETISGRTVIVEPRVDPRILGGVVAQIGSNRYDGSLSNQLVELAHAVR